MEPRYPAETIANATDFPTERCNQLTASMMGYVNLWSEFAKAARSALEDGRASEAKVLWLIADACSLKLRPKSMNDPFALFASLGGSRTALPSDFEPEDLALFEAVAPQVENRALQARLFDLAWVYKRPRNVTNARAAIDAYLAIPVDQAVWFNDGSECWERALTLINQIRSDRLDNAVREVVERFKLWGSGEERLSLSIARSLHQNRLGKDAAETILTRLSAVAEVHDSAGEHASARAYWECSRDWLEWLGSRDKGADTQCAIAESWAKEGTARLQMGAAANISATSCYESAIQAYRAVPRDYRATRGVDERLMALQALLLETGKIAITEMARFQSDPIDISDLISDARALVSGKPLREALLALTNVSGGIKREDLEKAAGARLKEGALTALFGLTRFSRDGRVIAKRPGVSGTSDSDEYRERVTAEMVSNHFIQSNLTAQAMIEPALNSFIAEHRVSLGELTAMARHSPIVPPSRAGLIARAIHAGFEGDFVSALHMVAPQVENIVRWHLKQAGVRTTVLSANGIANEIGLSALMELPETSKVMGKDLAFEIWALFCDPMGPNLRNEVAHGLLDDELSNSYSSMYAWWLLLRMTYNTFWNALRATENKAGSPTASDDEVATALPDPPKSETAD